MGESLRVLMVEDLEEDSELIQRELRKAGYEPTAHRVDRSDAMCSALDEPWDIVLSDFAMPDFGAPEALALLRERELDLPFIIVSGAVGEEQAAAMIKAGADEFVRKDNLARLASSIERARRAAESRRARRNAEEALRRTKNTLDGILTSASEYAIAAVDLENCVIHFNPAAERIFAIPANRIIGRTIDEIHRWHSVPPDRFREAVKEVLGCGKWESEIRVVDSENRLRMIHVVVMPMHDETGARTGLVLFGRDVTHENSLKRQLLHAQKMEAVGTLAGGIAHDFNNLLTAIYGYTDLAKGTLPAGHAAIQNLELVEKAAEKATGVVKALLTFSRKGATEKSAIELGRLLTESRKLLRPMLPSSIEMLTEIPESSPAWVMANPTQVQQVVLNLTSNSREAMPEGGTLRICVIPAGPKDGMDSSDAGRTSGEWCRLVIEDTGTGMTESVLSRATEPFFTTKQRDQGTGLGLAIVHAIVTDHHGSLEISSTPGIGTRVTVSLPSCAAPREVEKAPAYQEAERGRGERVLLVEDDPLVRSLMTSYLREYGYEVVQTGDGVEGFEAVRKDPRGFDLVILDLDLPKLNGLAFLRDIHSAGHRFPVLVVTGGSESQAREYVKPNHRVLCKPFEMIDFVSEVADVLAETGLTQES